MPVGRPAGKVSQYHRVAGPYGAPTTPALGAPPTAVVSPIGSSKGPTRPRQVRGVREHERMKHNAIVGYARCSELERRARALRRWKEAPWGFAWR